jgi:tetratricopeptide (TPR) repeat protein
MLLLLSVQSCGGLRTELYREETHYRYQSASQLYRQGDYTAAETGFEAVIAMDSAYGQAHAALGHLALIREDYPAALIHYQDAIAAAPELKPDLQPFILAALAHRELAPLRQAGVCLGQLYPLIMADRLAEVETILANDIPLQRLAGDTMGITPGRLGEMQHKIAETADRSAGSLRFRLFAGYVLFFGQMDDNLAAALIASAAEEAEGSDRQKALVVLGQINERRGDANAAVDAYLAAVDAGLPMTEVAHHLARVYRVDIETILPAEYDPEEATTRPDPMGIEISMAIPPSRPVNLGAAALPEGINPTGSKGSRNTF